MPADAHAFGFRPPGGRLLSAPIARSAPAREVDRPYPVEIPVEQLVLHVRPDRVQPLVMGLAHRVVALRAIAAYDQRVQDLMPET